MLGKQCLACFGAQKLGWNTHSAVVKDPFSCLHQALPTYGLLHHVPKWASLSISIILYTSFLGSRCSL